MTEKTIRKWMVNTINDAGGHATPHEDVASLGVPDLSFTYRGVSGWVELKYRAKKPVRPSTILRLGVSPAQRDFLKARKNAGAHVRLAARVGVRFYMWDYRGILACDHVTLQQMKQIAIMIEDWPPDRAMFLGLLSGKYGV